MPAAHIPILPAAPSRLDRPATFTLEAEEFVAALVDFGIDINSFIDYLNGLDTASSTPATTTQQLAGTDAAARSTPDSVAALWEKGADIASAGTISIGEGGYFHVTGTTTITDIDPAPDKAGRAFVLVFDGVLTLTHNASTLILPGGASITTAAGDAAIFRSEGSDVVRCVAYQRASGAALVASGATEASDSEIWTGTDTSKVITPRRLISAAVSQALTDGATITPDFNAGFNFHVTLGGNRTLANPTNIKAGQSGRIRVKQDATGNRTLAFGSYWLFPGGDPTLSTAANAIDVIAFYCHSSTEIEASCIKALA